MALRNLLATQMFTLLWKLFLSRVSMRADEQRGTQRAILKEKTSLSLSLKGLNKSVFTSLWSSDDPIQET